MASVLQAIIATASVMIYMSCFVMGFGVIPNILCSEIFPTRVRGLCITICALTYWIGNIIVTYSLPVLLSSIGLSGVFTIYAIACMVSWLFVFLKVPETKGMPLEVISEFFAVGAAAFAKNDWLEIQEIKMYWWKMFGLTENKNVWIKVKKENTIWDKRIVVLSILQSSSFLFF